MFSQERIQEEIIVPILNTKNQLEKFARDKKTLFLAFWDFDGTILKGDCSEGLIENGKQVFPGLVELGILSGFSSEFRGEEGVTAFWKKYREMEDIDKREAYIFLPRIFSGLRESQILDLAKKHFHETSQKYYFPSSIYIFEKLRQAGVESHIVSASANFFVKGIEGTLPINPDLIYGIETEIVDGIITKKEILPVTYGEGKKDKLELVVETILKEKKAEQVFILAGFGNSFHTDGHFLKYIVEQNFEKGKPISVMINGGNAPVEFKGLFKEVSFDL